MMTYFPRSLLAGKNLKRLDYATVHGSKRRLDPDGISAVPYFAGVVATQTLTFLVDGSPYTAVLSSNAYSAILTDIQTGLAGSGAVVTDADGSIQVTHSIPGGLNYILVSGGTAAEALGFDPNTSPAFSFGGDIPRAPEGRVGNPSLTAFPGGRENFSSSTLQRSFGLLSGNSDILYSDGMRGEVVLKKVTRFSSSNGKYVTLLGSDRVYTGTNGVLSRLSTKEDLAPYFTIVDKATGQIASSRVVAVVNGTPGLGSPPYADTASWAAADGGNILGLDLDKVTAAAIDSVSQSVGVITALTATFQTAGVQQGDLVEITGATNSPYSHNGYKWLVEEVISEQKLRVRPMSISERVAVNYSTLEMDPVLELNETINTGGGEVYGFITVRTGYSWAGGTLGAILVVKPDLVPNANYDIWFASPSRPRLSDIQEKQLGQSPSLLSVVSDFDPEPNGLVSKPVLGASGGSTIAVGSFYVRWHGRVIRVGAQTLNVPVNPVAVSIIYWDGDSCSLQLYVASTAPPVGIPTTLFSGPAVPDATLGGMGFQIAEMFSTSGTAIAIFSTAKLANGEKCSVTVGHGGNFESIQEAANFLLMMRFVTSETTATGGAYSHFEIVLLSDQTITSQVDLSSASLTIRGVNKSVRLITNVILGTSVFYTVGDLTLENLTLKVTTGQPILVERDGSSIASKICIRDVRQDTTGLSLLEVVRSGYSLVDVLIEDCEFTVSRYIVEGASAVNDVHISRSTISYLFVAPYVAPMMLVGDAKTLRISNSSFPLWNGGGSGVVCSTSASPSLTDISLVNSKFDFQGQTDPASWFMVVNSARCTVSGCYINMSNNAGINGSNGVKTIFENCVIYTNSLHASLPAFGSNERFSNNDVYVQAGSNNRLFNTSGSITDNVFGGDMVDRYVLASTGARISGNNFTPSALGTLSYITFVIEAGSQCIVSNNIIDCSGVSCAYGVNVTSANVVVSNNVITLDGGFSPALSYGIGLNTGNDCKTQIIGNTVTNCYNAIYGVATSNDNAIIGNHFESNTTAPFTFGGEFADNHYVGVVDRSFKSNDLLIRDSTFVGATFNFTGSNNSITGCKFTGTTLTTISSRADSTFVQVVGNRFVGPTTLIGCMVDNCSFANTSVTAVGVGSNFFTACVVSNSYFTGLNKAIDLIRMRNSTLIGCQVTIRIQDDDTLTCQFNRVIGTYCYSNISGSTYEGMYFSDRTYKLLVEGCDTATVNGDYSTNWGPRDVSISSTRTDQIRMSRCGLITVTNCKVGLRNTTVTSTTASRFSIGFQPSAGAHATLTGTLTFGATTAVTGVGTKFKTEVQVGDTIFRSTDAPSATGRVVSVASDTALTLASNYSGTAGSGTALCGIAHGTFIGNDIDVANGGTFSIDATVAYGGTEITFSGNKLTGTCQIDLASSSLPELSLVNKVTMVGNTILGGGVITSGNTVTNPAFLMITGNSFESGLRIDVNSGVGSWGTNILYSGSVSNNTIGGELRIRYARGMVVSANSIVGQPTNQLLSFFRCLDVIVDANYIYKTGVVPSTFNRLVEFNDVRRARLTNNILGSYWDSTGPDPSDLLLFGGNVGPVGYDLIIMGNHQYFVGAGAPPPATPTLVAGATVWWLGDGATTQTNPSRQGGTVSNPGFP